MYPRAVDVKVPYNVTLEVSIKAVVSEDGRIFGKRPAIPESMSDKAEELDVTPTDLASMFDLLVPGWDSDVELSRRIHLAAEEAIKAEAQGQIEK